MTADHFDPTKPTAVILLNLGGPDTIKAIRPFLQNLFSDREIIKLPVQPLLARLIARSRSKKIAARYEAIGGGSPIVKLTKAQASATETKLRARGVDCRLYVGMSYWHPFIKEAVAAAADDGFSQILALTLFPHFSRATTGSCLRALEGAVDRVDAALTVLAIEQWPDDPAYLDALAAQLKLGLEKFTAAQREDLKVIFSAHSLPQEFVDQGDPYPDQIKETIDGLIERVGPLDWILSYQSRSGPVEWMEPQTDKVIVETAESGTKNVLMVPISFVSDHIETLYEIDVMYKELGLSRGLESFERVPALNNSGLFIEALAGLVESKLSRQAASGETDE